MARPKDLITVDFETEAIVGNPIMYPPKPVGVAVTSPDMTTNYFVGEEMEEMCRHIWTSGKPVLFHNAPFDLSVARTHFGLEFPAWDRIHDTMYLLYLKDPHARSLSLKPSAELYLDMPPMEQDDLRDWLVENIPEATAKNFGAHISKAPVELVAPYAKGDTIRTRMLFDQLYDQTPHEPYNRECELMPLLVNATVRGVRVNRTALKATLTACELAQELCEQRIRGRLGCATLNPHSGAELAKALDEAGAITEWKLTPTGRKSTARANLMAGIDDPELLNLLVYTGAMQTAIGTFMRPWLEKSKEDGRLHPNWNQIRSTEDRTKGTRTGRLSSDDPNFQNIPTPFNFPVPEGLCEMPLLRSFILPEEGHVWLKRDWSAQEMRILAHFEDGKLCEAYNEDPTLDAHNLVRDIVADLTGKTFDRKFIKETGFGMIYGMGAPGLAKKIGDGMTTAEARELQESYKLALPGVGELQKGTKKRGRLGQPLTTWGGREYYAENPRIIGGSYRSFEYKLTNYLIQGSAADQAKQCLIDWWKGKPDSVVFMATVHDEINISAPIEEADKAMAWLKQCMNQDYFDVAMLSDALIGDSWGSIEEYSE